MSSMGVQSAGVPSPTSPATGHVGQSASFPFSDARNMIQDHDKSVSSDSPSEVTDDEHFKDWLPGKFKNAVNKLKSKRQSHEDKALHCQDRINRIKRARSRLTHGDSRAAAPSSPSVTGAAR